MERRGSGNYFTTTGEILIHSFTTDGAEAGETLTSDSQDATISLELSWTFPMNYIAVIKKNEITGVPRNPFVLSSDFTSQLQGGRQEPAIPKTFGSLVNFQLPRPSQLLKALNILR